MRNCVLEGSLLKRHLRRQEKGPHPKTEPSRVPTVWCFCASHGALRICRVDELVQVANCHRPRVAGADFIHCCTSGDHGEGAVRCHAAVDALRHESDTQRVAIGIGGVVMGPQ